VCERLFSISYVHLAFPKAFVSPSKEGLETVESGGPREAWSAGRALQAAMLK
jgi:hypothetical protein